MSRDWACPCGQWNADFRPRCWNCNSEKLMGATTRPSTNGAEVKRDD